MGRKKCRNGNLWEEPGFLKAFSPGKTRCNINQRNVFLRCTIELVRESGEILQGTKKSGFSNYKEVVWNQRGVERRPGLPRGSAWVREFNSLGTTWRKRSDWTWGLSKAGGPSVKPLSKLGYAFTESQSQKQISSPGKGTSKKSLRFCCYSKWRKTSDHWDHPLPKNLLL